MAINRTMTGLLACGLQLLCVAFAAAQEDPYLPAVGDVQIFDKADIGTYGNGPKHPEGWFGKYDWLQWTVSGPDRTTIGAEGFTPEIDTGFGNIVQANGATTDFIDTQFVGGNRVEFGFIRDDVGWLSSTWSLHASTHRMVGSDIPVSFIPQVFGVATALEGFIDTDADGIDEDLDGDMTYGRFGTDLGTPDGAGGFNLPFDGVPDQNFGTDLDDLVTFPTFFKNLYVRNETRVWGTELMRVWRVCKSPRGVFEVFGGVRYVNLEDKFIIESDEDEIPRFGFTADDETVPTPDGDTLSGSPGPATVSAALESKINTRTDNDLVGPQIGFRVTRRAGGRLTFSHESRLLLAANMQSFRQEGFLANQNSQGLQNQPFQLLPQYFNTGASETEFSPLGEIRFEANYQLFRSVSLQAGYTAIMADNIARASNHINYIIPGMGIAAERDDDTMFFNGFNFGFTVNR